METPEAERPRIGSGASSGKLYDRRLLRQLWQYARPERWALFAGVLLLPTVATLHLLQPYLYKVAIDGHILKGDFQGLRGVIALFVLLLALEFLARYLQAYLVQAAGQRITHRLRVTLFAHLQGLSLPILSRHPSGALMTRVIGDTEAVSHLFVAGIIGLLGDLILLSQIVGIMSLMNWKLTLLTFSAVPPLFFLLAFLRRKIREHSRKVRTLVAALSAYLQESLAGMPTIQLFLRRLAKIIWPFLWSTASGITSPSRGRKRIIYFGP
ncbi:MAG: ABC transporter ATP-binding protein [Nitrospinae bacterium]|nr:ABC transporter ATP-binding protein [Nitrospinota bacterium]